MRTTIASSESESAMSAPASSLPAQSGARSRSRTRSVTRSPSHDSYQIVAHEERGTPLRCMLCPAATDHADEVAVKQANFLGDLPLMRWARYRQTGSKAVPAGTLCRYCDATRRRWFCAFLGRDLTTAMLLQELKSVSRRPVTTSWPERLSAERLCALRWGGNL